MIRTLSIAALIFGATLSYGQSNLKTQIKLCKSDVERLEAENKKLKEVLQAQYNDNSKVKSEKQDAENENVRLKERVGKLEYSSVILLDIAKELEAKDMKQAIKIYELITKVYPGTVESSSAHYRLREIKFGN